MCLNKAAVDECMIDEASTRFDLDAMMHGMQGTSSSNRAAGCTAMRSQSFHYVSRGAGRYNAGGRRTCTDSWCFIMTHRYTSAPRTLLIDSVPFLVDSVFLSSLSCAIYILYMFSDTVMSICFMLWGRGISGPGGHSQINILLRGKTESVSIW